jgi:hypothetical protein
MIKKYQQFLLEKRLYIFTRSFRLGSLISAGIYPQDIVEGWMKENTYDEFATGIFVSETAVKSKSNFDIRLKERDIKNKNSFDDSTRGYAGKIMPDSEIESNGDILYVYVFDKNSNEEKRARQNHGFKYESQIIKGNGLHKKEGYGAGYTDKWDASGTLNKNYLDEKTGVDCKTVEIGTNEGRLPAFWESIGSEFKENLNWSIKCMAKGTDVELGDFLRISGYKRSTEGIVSTSGATFSGATFSAPEDSKSKKDKKDEKFMLCVSFHDNSSEKKVIEEYFIPIKVEDWKTLLPDIEGNKEIFNSMYRELRSHRIVGKENKTYETEAAWKAYMNKYKPLFKNSAIKIRFKRDSKGQLRLQAAISNANFINHVLKHMHIRIR